MYAQIERLMGMPRFFDENGKVRLPRNSLRESRGDLTGWFFSAVDSQNT